jgi:uncharacterized protein (TIGR02391 family)
MLPSFSQPRLLKISQTLAECVQHKELSGIFRQCGIIERDGTPKWERMVRALEAKQSTDRCGNNVGAFIECVMDPARFVNHPEDFAGFRDSLNVVLAFDGLQVNEAGKLESVSKAQTLTEAQHRAGRLRSDLEARRVHPDVLRFCRAELVQENYFHAVFEATKSVAQKIRDKTSLTGDGADIVDAAFGIKAPLLAINTLRTETEQSEQKGFATLLKGIFGTFRNVTAHAPKVEWPMGEQDALDLMTMASYAHRKLDGAVIVPKVPSSK